MSSTIECYSCGISVAEDDVYIPYDIQEPHCDDCIRDCSYCGEWFADIYIHLEYECDICGRDICPRSCYTFCDYCCQYRCERCDECPHCNGRSHRAIRDYHDNPSLIFHGNGDYHMGIELEYNGDGNDIVGAVHQFDDCEQFVWACEDGSLYGGAEIISHPMTLDYIRNGFPFADMMQAIKATGSASITSGTGLHVHIDRRAFMTGGRYSETHAYRWIKFILANQAGAELVGRRTSEEWAQFVSPGDYGHKGYSDTLRSKCRMMRTCDNRYTAVNTTKTATYELRFFKSTYNRRFLFAAVEYAHSTVEYTRRGMGGMGLDLADAFRWPSFTRWLAARADQYPNLAGMVLPAPEWSGTDIELSGN